MRFGFNTSRVPISEFFAYLGRNFFTVHDVNTNFYNLLMYNIMENEKRN